LGVMRCALRVCGAPPTVVIPPPLVPEPKGRLLRFPLGRVQPTGGTGPFFSRVAVQARPQWVGLRAFYTRRIAQRAEPINHVSHQVNITRVDRRGFPPPGKLFVLGAAAGNAVQNCWPGIRCRRVTDPYWHTPSLTLDEKARSMHVVPPVGPWRASLNATLIPECAEVLEACSGPAAEHEAALLPRSKAGQNQFGEQLCAGHQSVSALVTEGPRGSPVGVI